MAQEIKKNIKAKQTRIEITDKDYLTTRALAHS